MFFSFNYSKCEIIVGLFFLNFFGYGKVKMFGGFIIKKKIFKIVFVNVIIVF